MKKFYELLNEVDQNIINDEIARLTEIANKMSQYILSVRDVDDKQRLLYPLRQQITELVLGLGALNRLKKN